LSAKIILMSVQSVNIFSLFVVIGFIGIHQIGPGIQAWCLETMKMLSAIYFPTVIIDNIVIVMYKHD